MAGLLAANILRRHEVTIIEAKPSLPTNHKALLRFRSPAVSDATGIPFTKVLVHKGVWDGEQVITNPTFAHANTYSMNVTEGELHDRSITKFTEASERWIAPENFVELLSDNIDIIFGEEFTMESRPEGVLTISTIPMPVMMRMVNYGDKPKFNYRPVWTVRAHLVKPASFVHQTLYNATPSSWYRATLQGSNLILEYAFEPSVDRNDEACSALACFFSTSDFYKHYHSEFNDITIHKTPIGKITPINERLRRSFMMHLTDAYGIYSLGRFACWRNILLDDVVVDVKRIEAMITKTTDDYQRRLTYTTKNESDPY